MESSEAARALAARRKQVISHCESCGREMLGTLRRRYCSDTCRVRTARQRRGGQTVQSPGARERLLAAPGHAPRAATHSSLPALVRSDPAVDLNTDVGAAMLEAVSLEQQLLTLSDKVDRALRLSARATAGVEGLVEAMEDRTAEPDRDTQGLETERLRQPAEGLIPDFMPAPAFIHPPTPSRSSSAGFIRDDLGEWITLLTAQSSNQWWMKCGLPTNTLPVGSPSYQQRFLETFPGEQAQFILSARMTRLRAAKRALSTSESEYRYIIPRAFIERYVHYGLPSYDEFEAQYPDWRATTDERIERIENLLDFLNFSNFHLALTSEAIFDIWWGVFDSRAILFELCIGQPTDGLCFKVETQEIIKQYRDRYQRLWGESFGDKDEIRAYLRDLLRQLRP